MKTVRHIVKLLACLCAVIFPSIVNADQRDIGLTPDFALTEVNGEFKQGSHVKLYIPNLPYVAISHAINAALLRPANNEQGWQYDLATHHSNQDDKVWEFELRKNVTFHDGSAFNADSVIENVKAFKKAPFTFSKFATVLERVEKLGEYRVRFHMNEAYGAFPYDAIWLQFYSTAYLEKFGWNGKPTCPNLAESGLYGLGPYILTSGYVEGDRRSAKVELKASKNYWGEDKPKVEQITINLDIEPQQAFNNITQQEGAIDVMPIAFSNQLAAVQSKYAKLASTPSKNNYAMHFNLVTGHQAIKEKRIRRIINQAIDQDYLLNLSMLGEGVSSPTMVSPNFYRLNEAIESLDTYFKNNDRQSNNLDDLREEVKAYQLSQGLDPDKPLTFSVLAQKSFLFLIKDIQYFLKQVNIELDATILPTEEEIFEQLHITWQGKNSINWDLLLWGNTDWYKHPWSAFFVYQPAYAWSTLTEDNYLVSLIDQLFHSNTESKEYVSATSAIIRHVHENDLMVFLPTPNNVFAINKEVYFTPGSSAFVYLRDIDVTEHHWSVRGERPLPQNRTRAIAINKNKLDKVQ